MSEGSGSRRWKIATVAVAVAGLLATLGVWVVMDGRLDDLRAEGAARDQLGDSRADDATDDDGPLRDLLDGLGSDALDRGLLQCLSDGLPGRGAGSIPEGAVSTQVEAIRTTVESERGLAAEGDLDIAFVSRQEVRRRATEQIGEELDAERAAVDGRFLAALGALDPDTDLLQAQLDAVDAGVAGFYDPQTGQLVIGSEEMDGLGAFTTAHELVHAVADAEFGLPDTTEIATSAGADAAFAALAAIEGDASLYSQRFAATHLQLTDLLQLQLASLGTSADLERLPHVVRRELEFPYLEGLAFTCDVYRDGGWPAVDATYRRPPTTTAQILFPERYRAGETATDVRDPAGPAGWTTLRTDTFGAADLMFLLEAPGDDPGAALPDIAERVEAWAGGQFTVWGRGQDTAVAVVLADRGDGQPSLCDTVTDFAAAAFPDAQRSDPERSNAGGAEATFRAPERTAVVTCAGDEVALGIGADPAVARDAVG